MDDFGVVRELRTSEYVTLTLRFGWTPDQVKALDKDYVFELLRQIRYEERDSISPRQFRSMTADLHRISRNMSAIRRALEDQFIDDEV